MAFTSPAFDPAKPAGTDLVSDVDTFIKDFKVQVLERQLLEHYSYLTTGTNAGSATDTAATAHGRHIPGKCGVVYVGTTAQIAALTGTTPGCIAYDTDKGQLVIYGGGTWSSYGSLPRLAFKGYASSAQTYATASVNQKVLFHTQAFDYGNVFVPGIGTTDSRFTVVTDGVYSLSASAGLNGSATGMLDVFIRKNGTTAVATGTNSAVNSTNRSHVFIQSLISAVAGDYFEVVMYYEGGSSRAMLTGESTMFFCGQQVY